MARFVVSLVLTLALLPATAVAAPGDFDSSFGGDGSVSLDWGPFSSVEGVLVQGDGRIVASGGGGDPSALILGRLTSNGPVDTGFGIGGITTLSLVGGEWADDVARQPDGKIVAAGLTGSAQPEGIVMRLKPDGTADDSFGTGGIVELPYGGPDDLLDDVLIQPDGKIVVVGKGGKTDDWVVTRLTPQGLPDSSFDGDGTAVLNLGGDDWASSVALQADGKLVIAGHSSAQAIWVARLNADGSPDTGFSGDGRLPLQPASGSVSWDMVVQPDGKIVVAGYESGSSFLVTRLKPDGSYDEDFANGEGLAAVSFGSSDMDTANAVALQASGKIVVAGSTTTGASKRLAVARLQPGGSLDTTFSGDGKQTLSGATSAAWGIALAPDGRIVMSGDRGDGALVVRLQGDGQAGGGGPAPTPGGGGSRGGGGKIKQVPSCAGKRATIVGTGRSDRLKGTRRADVIVALGGNDNIAAGRGNDLICAGDGNDKIAGGLGNDRLFGQNGKDKLAGDSGKDQLDGGGGKDQLSGGSGRDSCNGGSGKDRGYCERNRSL
jgi:uncharacterized delta-60 repeat protein